MNDLERVVGPVSRETLGRLETFAELLAEENQRQNLIGQTTEREMWTRHILDSAQLVPLVPRNSGSLVDIGSGAGLPGVVISCFNPCPVTLLEPRRLRAEFLSRVVDTLGLSAVVACAKAGGLTGQYDVISARAVASLHRLLGLAQHLSHDRTTWILPKGRNAKSELEQASRNWHCHVEAVPSRTSPESTIFVITNVKAKRRS